MAKLLMNAMAVLSFGDWLLLKRRALDVSQEDIANALGVTRQSISKWEGNQAKPALDPDQTMKLCTILQADLATIAKAFRGEIEMNE